MAYMRVGTSRGHVVDEADLPPAHPVNRPRSPATSESGSDTVSSGCFVRARVRPGISGAWPAQAKALSTDRCAQKRPSRPKAWWIQPPDLMPLALRRRKRKNSSRDGGRGGATWADVSPRESRGEFFRAYRCLSMPIDDVSPGPDPGSSAAAPGGVPAGLLLVIRPHSRCRDGGGIAGDPPPGRFIQEEGCR